MASAHERPGRRGEPSTLACGAQRGNASARRPQWRRPLKYALINPNWSFEGSIYFGCREPHLPLEYGYSKALLEEAGHDVLIVDGQLEDLSLDDIRRRVGAFRPDFTIITTAPSY